MQPLADPTMRFTSDEGEMIWSDNRSMSSDENVARTMLPQHHLPIGHSWVPTGAMVQVPNGQISSHSPEMDIVMETTEAPPMVHSSSSSCAEDWNDATNYEPEEPENESNWEQGSDDVLMIPKIEPIDDDDDFNLNDVMVAPLVPDPAEPTDPKATAQPKQKRPRGRPRKHPLPSTSNTGKVTKGRSKTGCVTCRKRKKKCDETKPRCLNCEKNAVICEGYPEKALWQSGKDKVEEERLRRESLPQITMPPLFLGVETPEDLIFWKHYINHVSNVFTVEGETKNAFKDIILQLAHKNQGLMHGILAVSSRHLDLDTPYGTKILADNPKTSKEKLEERKDFHGDEAMKCLREAMDDKTDPNDPEYETRLCARYAQMLCMVLQTMADGGPHGVHRIHMHGYLHLVETTPPKDLTFYSFIVEFFQYHIYAADLFWHPSMVERQVSDDWRAPVQISPARLIGVEDGLLSYMTNVTTIRNTIRENMAANNDPVVDYRSLYRAAEIDASIRDWEPNWPLGDNRDRVGILFKQMVWIYLFRTIYPPSTPSIRRSTFSTFPPQVHSAGEPPRRASMVATVSTAKVPIRRLSAMSMSHDVPQSCPVSRNISRHNSMHENEMHAFDMHTRDASPPPNRRPPYHDQRIRTALTESFDIIESFSASDPVQTLLLIPCFIIGTAAFEETDRKRVRNAIRTIRGYTGLRNCDRAIALLEELWGLMQQGDWHSVWDWQALAQRAGLDFCI